MKKAVFLDRDGVINRAIVRDGKPYPPATLAAVELVDFAIEGFQQLHDAGYLLIVVTNQPDVARGTAKREDVEAINQFLQAKLPLDAFYTCYHDSQDKCHCRKPLPGLLLMAAYDYHIDFEQSFIIGDRWRDIEAGAAAGCKTLWIDYDYQEKKPDKPDIHVYNLRDAINAVLFN